MCHASGNSPEVTIIPDLCLIEVSLSLVSSFYHPCSLLAGSPRMTQTWATRAAPTSPSLAQVGWRLSGNIKLIKYALDEF